MSARARARARKRSAGAKPKRTKDARRKSSPKNGAKGGRPRDKLPKSSLDKLGPPPLDAKGRAEWNANVLAEVLWLSLSGSISNDLATSIRAGAKSLDAALPSRPSNPNDDSDEDDDEEEDDGPNLVSVPGQGLRVE